MEEQVLLELGQSFLQGPEGQKLIAVAEGVKGNIDDFKASKETLNKYKPIITTFTTKGRLYDELTSEPIQGVEVKPQLVLFPMKLVTNQNYIYNSSGNKDIKTDKNGEYEIRFGTVSISGLPELVMLKPFVLYNLEGYAPAQQSLITLGGEVPQVLPIQKLLNIDEAAARAADKVKDEMNKFAEAGALIGLGSVELGLITIKSQILKFAGVAQNKLFPLAMSLMIIFGITKLEKAAQEQARCPNNALLRECIKRRNSIVRQINQMWVVIAANTALAALFLYLSLQLKGVKEVISGLSFPLAVPPGVGVPYSLVAKLEDVKKLLNDLGDISKDLKKALLISLIFLVISLIIILRYLKRIDELIEGCAANNGNGDNGGGSCSLNQYTTQITCEAFGGVWNGGLSMVEINAELLAIQENSEQQGNSIIANINGFKLSVIKEEKFKVGDLYRRRAIAKNSGGITILQGEPSFSAEDQILLDELAFYIVQNNLKAD